MSNKISEKWNSILNPTDTGKTLTWLDQYSQRLYSNFGGGIPTPSSSNTGSSIDWSSVTLLPMAMKVAATTIGFGGWYKSEIQQLKENRINKLRKVQGLEPNVVLPNDKYQDGLVSVTPMSAPTGQLFYIDYVYKDIRSERKKKLIKIDRIVKIKYIDEMLKNNL